MVYARKLYRLSSPFQIVTEYGIMAAFVWRTAETHRPAYVIMMVADVLAPNRHQVISNHHADSSVTWWRNHYGDVIMNAMAPQITGVLIVCSTVCSSADQRKHQSYTSLAFMGNPPVTVWFLSQRASDAENVSIWWRYHVCRQIRHITKIMYYSIVFLQA